MSGAPHCTTRGVGFAARVAKHVIFEPTQVAVRNYELPFPLKVVSQRVTEPTGLPEDPDTLTGILGKGVGRCATTHGQFKLPDDLSMESK